MKDNSVILLGANYNTDQNFMNSYARRLILFPVLLVAYFIVAVVGHNRAGQEVFPFFTWSLFTYIPSPIARPELWVKRVGENKFQDPKPYYQLKRYFPTASRGDSVVAKLVSRMVAAHGNARAEQFEDLRILLETKYLNGKDVDYIIAVVSYEPIERWRSGAILKLIPVYENSDDQN